VASSRRRRAGLSEAERRKVGVRAGGRCTLCKRYLLEGDLTWQEVPLGEGAHIVGQEKNARSPRGLDPLPDDARDTAENVMLACDTCHKEIDHKRAAGVMTVEELRRRKQEHQGGRAADGRAWARICPLAIAVTRTLANRLRDCSRWQALAGLRQPMPVQGPPIAPGSARGQRRSAHLPHGLTPDGARTARGQFELATARINPRRQRPPGHEPVVVPPSAPAQRRKSTGAVINEHHRAASVARRTRRSDVATSIERHRGFRG
jgi:hypothetical protein